MICGIIGLLCIIVIIATGYIILHHFYTLWWIKYGYKDEKTVQFALYVLAGAWLMLLSHDRFRPWASWFDKKEEGKSKMSIQQKHP